MRKLLKKCLRDKSLTYGKWCSINSYNGWLKWCNSYNLYLKYIKPLEFYTKKYYKEVVKGENIQ